MQRITAADIRRSYSSEKALSDKLAHLWLYLVLRPISFHLTPIFINLGIGANGTTLLGLILLICGLTFILLGAFSPINFIIGAVLVNFWYLFDAIDGNIARFLGQTSKLGVLLDWMVGQVYHNFLPLCLGLALFFTDLEPSIQPFKYALPRWIWLLACAVEIFTGLSRNMVSLKTQMVLEGQVAIPLDSIPSILSILPRAILSFKAPLFLVASLVGASGIWLLGYASYSLVLLVGMILLSLRKAHLKKRERIIKKEV